MPDNVKKIYKVDLDTFRQGQKGTSKGVVVSCLTTGNTKDSEAYMFSFLPFTFDDDCQIKFVTKGIVMYDPEKVPEGVPTPWKEKNDNRVVVDKFSHEVLQKILLNVEVVVAHNASFVYHFLSQTFGKSAFRSTPFACTMKGINFAEKGINTLSLEFLAYKYDLWYNLQEEETAAIIKILSLDDNFPELVERLFLPSNKIVLNSTAYSDKDKIKSLGYHWNPDKKNWYKNDVTDPEKEEASLNDLGIYCSLEVIPIAPEEKYKTEGI